MRAFLAALLLCASRPSAGLTERPWSFLQEYRGKSSNAVVWDPRFQEALSRELPPFSADLGVGARRRKTPLAEALRELLSGPPDDVSSPQPGTFVVSACRAHDCPEKGFLWVEPSSGRFLAALVHYIFEGAYFPRPQLFVASKDFPCAELPARAVEPLKAWLAAKQVKPQRVRCLERDGRVVNTSL